jgi:excisionase family DNA binding protein
MASDFESAFRQLLKSVVQEVASELLIERRSHNRPSVPNPKQADESVILLRSREAAKRLQVSERHLQKLTQAGVLPCVRVGQCVRYSVEAIQNFIRDAESKSATSEETSARGKRPTITPTAKTVKKPVQGITVRQEKKKPENRIVKTEPPVNRRTAPRKVIVEPEVPKRITPFDQLLQEIGVDRSDLPPLTNGELRRIAEVDIPTLHGWTYHGHEMPEAALKKLREHFGAYRKDISRPESGEQTEITEGV